MGKNILIFSDGTGQQGGLRTDQNLTNVYKLYRAARSGSDSPIDPRVQVAYYDPGLGTERDEGKIHISLLQCIRKWLSTAIGFGISRNIADCYEAILKHYEPEDRIFLFGFSRGAYTVRALADVLALCGIPTRTDTTAYCPRYGNSLRAIAEEAVTKIYNHGAGRNRVTYAPERDELARRFKAKYGSENNDGKSNAVPYCIGVFDTVAALGASGIERWIMNIIIGVFSLVIIAFLAKLSTCLFSFSFWVTFCAISTLVGFGVAYLLYKSSLKVIRDFPNPGNVRRHFAWWKREFYDEHLDTRIKFVNHALSIDETRSDFERVPWGKKSDSPCELDFKQIWFAGNHSDIGGSYPEDESRLSDITLDWMIKEITRIPHPVILDYTKLNIFPSADGMQHSEVEALCDSRYLRWLPTAWCFTWKQAPRKIDAKARCHPSVLERFKLPSVVQYSRQAPYRPIALKDHPEFKEFYNG